MNNGPTVGSPQNYMRAETITRANARLVAAQGLIRLARAWGGGDVATADGLRFVVPVRTLNAAHNGEFRPVRDPNQFDDEDPSIQQAAADDF